MLPLCQDVHTANMTWLPSYVVMLRRFLCRWCELGLSWGLSSVGKLIQLEKKNNFIICTVWQTVNCFRSMYRPKNASHWLQVIFLSLNLGETVRRSVRFVRIVQTDRDRLRCIVVTNCDCARLITQTVKHQEKCFHGRNIWFCPTILAILAQERRAFKETRNLSNSYF